MTNRETISTEIVDLFLDAGAERSQEIWDTGLTHAWLSDQAATAAFDRMCATLTPGSESWARVEEQLRDLVDEYEDEPFAQERVAELGTNPSVEKFGRWLFSRAATVPAAGSPGEFGEWTHDGIGEHRGVTFTAFSAIGVSEYFSVAVLSDADGDWTVDFCSV